MATATSSYTTTYCPRVILTVTQSSSTDTSATYSWTLQYYTYSSSYTMHTSYSKTVVAKFNGSTLYNAAVSVGYKSTFQISSGSVTVSKTTSSQSLALYVSIAWGSATWSGTTLGTRTGSGSITLAAKTSYTITYNANGGSGAPSSQTKWYGTTLTLSSTKPTRTNYTFLGWSTSSTATSATYSAGGSYTANAAATLYAVWKLSYIYPTITTNAVYRVADSSSTTEDAVGEYCYASYTFSIDTSIDSSNTAYSCDITYKISTDTSYTSATVEGTTTGTSGTFYTWFEASTDYSYEIVASVTDSYSNTNGYSATTSTSMIGKGVIPLQFYQNSGVGILSPAPNEGVSLGAGPVTMELDGADRAIRITNSVESTNTMINTTRSDTGASVDFGIVSGGINRGIYDSTSDINGWLIYRSSLTATDTVIPGALKIAGHSTSIGSLVSTYSSTSTSLTYGSSTSLISLSVPIGSWIIIGSAMYSAPSATANFCLSINSSVAHTSIGRLNQVNSGYAGAAIAVRPFVLTSATTIYLIGSFSQSGASPMTITYKSLYALRVA